MAPWFQAGTDPVGRINAYGSRTARNTGRINAPPTGHGCKIFRRGAIHGALVSDGYGSCRGAINAYGSRTARNTGRINAYSFRTARNTGRINAPPTGDGDGPMNAKFPVGAPLMAPWFQMDTDPVGAPLMAPWFQAGDYFSIGKSSRLPHSPQEPS